VLRGPGISDNCRGLAVLAAVAELLAGAGVPTDGSVTFVANVGEEGLGDLRGMKALFGETLKGQIDRFVSIDGAGGSITYVSVGSHRYRVRFLGPGGHSFGSFGLANPAHALGRAIARIAELKVPDAPRTTFNVGRIGGGTSVNSIPFEAWMEVDLRSSDPAALASLDEAFQRAMDQAATDENQRWGRPGVVTVAKELVGDRPAGMTPLNSPIVRIARDSARAVGVNAVLSEGSTDANVPMSLAIPAITIDGGGNGSGAHALNETFDTTNSWRGTQNALVVTLALLQAD
jgi:acetylornithine deacetylase/succinyl-diaminopimelate desuccinylase-like protein